MSYDYSKLLATSRRLLAKFGQSASITRTTTDPYDETTGTVPNPVTTVTVDSAVVLEYTKGLMNMPDSLIKMGDKKILTQMNIVPTTTDTILVNGTTYNIIGVKALEPSGLNLLYELHCRK